MVLGPKEYATPEQFELLKKFKKQGTLAEKELTRELWLTYEQAFELGYDVAEGEEFLLSPTERKPEALYGGIPPSHKARST
ncbi:unnamed protein product [marine sediment metagenome]|uniref:Uncharacterized protein n=1 Tax=marine sediment metagenome TaxID=412755 RepID=X1NMM8_9ZZZZ